MAPESRTIGNNAAAKPPARGSSGFALATRLETTTTLTNHLQDRSQSTFVEGLGSIFVMQCSEPLKEKAFLSITP
jgi:hypothetical protein